MDYWGVMVGLGLLASAFAVAAFVRYREREAATLQKQTVLARELRDLAGDDEVRLAAVDEFSLTIYQRLFYASVVAPWIRSAAWAFLGAALTAVGALAVDSLDGVYPAVVHIVLIAASAVFALSTLVFAGIALYHSASTPRVSFQDSYAADETVTPAAAPEKTTPATTPEKTTSDD
ncbi:hypothetical protein [Gordonia paraffinivorans]|uniref:hypothetical protein n=1 Tax=Gordonia paraffinivorans TaxID=175628 RepID=UPI000D61BC91|nr:hypothetical protein [Gordonia paraffinivorans]MBY4574534.1 hypothetical protein [Gordonia paraffinivorans]PWD41183.1 hypothetical protein ACN93_20280 [Gordonia paraffinivorans]